MNRLATIWKEIWAEQWQWRKRRICGVYGVTGKKKDKPNKKQGVRVNRDRDKIGVVNAQYIRVLAGTGDIGAYWVLMGAFELCI